MTDTGTDVPRTTGGQTGNDPAMRATAAPSEDASCEGTGTCGGTGSCGADSGCGGHRHGPPELDARQIDPAIRQSAIFGVLIGLAPASSVVVVSDQDPQPIADVVHERLPGNYSMTGEQVSGREWRVLFART